MKFCLKLVCAFLSPITGKKHQLRVHMAALGAPILGDVLYRVVPQPTPQPAQQPTRTAHDYTEQVTDDYSAPMRLLAKHLSFVDPIDGTQRRFTSTRNL